MEKTPSRPFLFLFPKECVTIISILNISCAVHLQFLSNTNRYIFDEVHFGGFLSDYINGICFFDIHPPLAKMMLAATGKLTGYQGDFNFSKVETKYTSNFYVPIRLCPALLCTLVSPLLTATLILQKSSLPMAGLCGILFTFEFNAITQSRLILTDGILYFFVAFSIFITALEERFQSDSFMLILQSLAASFAFCTKFTAAGLFILIALSHFKILFINNKKENWFLILCKRGIIVSIVFILFLYTIMVIHLKLMPNKGYGDLYMQRDFRNLPMFTRVFKLLFAMYRYNSNLRIDHPYKSKWYQWPFVSYTPIYIYSDYNKFLFLFSNPIPAFFSLLGFFTGFFAKDFTCLSYSIIYLISYFPFIMVDRCVFNYHYEIPLIFGILSLCLSISRILQKLTNARKIEYAIAFLLAIATVACFAFWFPFIYGTEITRDQMNKITIWKRMRSNFHLT